MRPFAVRVRREYQINVCGTREFREKRENVAKWCSTMKMIFFRCLVWDPFPITRKDFDLLFMKP